MACSTSHAIANPNAQASFFSCPLGASYLTGPMGAASDTTSFVNICREHFHSADSISRDILHSLEKVVRVLMLAHVEPSLAQQPPYRSRTNMEGHRRS